MVWWCEGMHYMLLFSEFIQNPSIVYSKIKTSLKIYLETVFAVSFRLGMYLVNFVGELRMLQYSEITPSRNSGFRIYLS